SCPSITGRTCRAAICFAVAGLGKRYGSIQMNKLVLMPIAVVCIITSSVVFAQKAKAPAEGKPAPAKSSKSDEQTLRDAVVSFVNKYDAHKADDVAALFASYARMVFADGTEVNGRDEIKQSFEAAFTASPKSAIS